MSSIGLRAEGRPLRRDQGDQGRLARRCDLREYSGRKDTIRNAAQNHSILDHDHIVPIYHVGEMSGMLYLVMRLIKGISLSEIVKKRARCRRAGLPITSKRSPGRFNTPTTAACSTVTSSPATS